MPPRVWPKGLPVLINNKALVLDMTNGSQVDFTSARALDDMIHDVQDNGRHAFVVCVRPAVRKFLGRQGVIANLAEGR